MITESEDAWRFVLRADRAGPDFPSTCFETWIDLRLLFGQAVGLHVPESYRLQSRIMDLCAAFKQV